MAEGRLYVCATPIGNLGDVSERLRQVLGSVDLIYAEDTRRVAKLLSHLGVGTPVRSLFSGNEQERSEELVARLEEGIDIALVSDAGTPVISDPGARVVGLAHGRGLEVSVVPGPSAVTSALALSGFPADRFSFEGFLPRKGKERRQRLERIADDDRVVVLFASPHRLAADLVALRAALGGGRRIILARELTKLHEEVWRGTLDEAVPAWEGEVKGEITLVVEAAPAPTVDHEAALARARELVGSGLTLSEAARQAAAETGMSRRLLYQGLLEDQV